MTDFVIETDHEMKEVGFPQVGRRLFSKVDSSNTNAEKGKIHLVLKKHKLNKPK